MKTFVVVAICVFLIGLMVTATRVWSDFVPYLHLRGATLSSLSSDLLISNEMAPSPEMYKASGELKGAQNIVPGGEEFEEFFWVWNTNSHRSLRLLARFVPGDGDWEKLAPLIEVQITPSNGMATAPWLTLSELAQNQHTVLTQLPSREQEKILVRYRMVSLYPLDPDGNGPILPGDLLGAEVQNLTTSRVGLELSTLQNP